MKYLNLFNTMSLKNFLCAFLVAFFASAAFGNLPKSRFGENYDESKVPQFELPDVLASPDGKIKASNFVQKKGETYTHEKMTANPIVRLPMAEDIVLPEDKQERLSVIIAEINSKTGRAYDNDVAIKAMLQIRDLLLKSEKLRISAKNNTEKDFEFSYFDDIDDALIEGLSQNQDFFSLLLNDEELKRQVLGIFTSEIYKSLRNS